MCCDETIACGGDETIACGALVEARASREVSTLKLYPGTPRPSTTPDSWAVAERHRANICSDVAWVVYESHESH